MILSTLDNLAQEQGLGFAWTIIRLAGGYIYRFAVSLDYDWWKCGIGVFLMMVLMIKRYVR